MQHNKHQISSVYKPPTRGRLNHTRAASGRRRYEFLRANITIHFRMVSRTLVVLAGCLSLAAASLIVHDAGELNPLLKSTSAEKRYEWLGTNVRFPCVATRKIYESTGRYISKNMISTRFQLQPLNWFNNTVANSCGDVGFMPASCPQWQPYKDEVIVALPRYKEGVAITLGKAVFKKGATCSPVFHPYPCWSLQEEGNPEAIQSAVDIFLDGRDRLWVLDSGVTNTLTQPIRRSPPKVVVICVKTHKVIRVIDLSNLVCPASRLQYLVVDQSVYGHTYLYISDAANRSILVWDVHANRGWRVVLPKAVLAGCHRRDVLYLALVRRPCGSSVLYFTYLSSTRIFSIRTEFLRRGSSRGRVVDLGRKPAKIILLGADGGTKLFFRYQGDSYIYQWDTLTCFKKQNFVLVYKGGDCRLATHVASGHKNLMYGIESNFHDYIQDKTGCVGPSVSLFPLIKPCKVHQVSNCKTCGLY